VFGHFRCGTNAKPEADAWIAALRLNARRKKKHQYGFGEARFILPPIEISFSCEDFTQKSYL
jgi:hypothetical protein